MAHGLRHLRFNCTRCGNCCRRFRVPLTGADLQRLVRGTGLRAREIIEWLSPEQVDMTGEPETFVRFAEGRRLMMLAWQREGCRFSDDDLCAVHDVRPSSCRMYPYDVQLGRRGGIRRLKLLDVSECEHTWAEPEAGHRVAIAAARHRAELVQYVHDVAQFNRLQEHRRRLGKKQLRADDFFAHIDIPTKP